MIKCCDVSYNLPNGTDFIIDDIYILKDGKFKTYLKLTADKEGIITIGDFAISKVKASISGEYQCGAGSSSLSIDSHVFSDSVIIPPVKGNYSFVEYLVEAPVRGLVKHAPER